MNVARLIPLLVALAGCGAGPVRLPTDVPDAQKAPRTVAMRITAAAKLNTNARGQPLALVTRIYKLRQRAAFDQAPYDTFLSPEREQAAFGADLLEVKEVILVPGQQYQAAEKVSREAGFVGVVALFHMPAPQRWRHTFAIAEIEKTGLSLAALSCALSAGGATGAAPAPCQ